MGYDPPFTWKEWLVDDQREFSGRTDVVSYVSDVLGAPVHIQGQPVANLVASTSRTDWDWVVKLMNVYPDEVPASPTSADTNCPAIDISAAATGRVLTSATTIEPNTPLTFQFTLPMVDHVFLPGHRIMVQVQSSWFPLYDRNPQTFVPNLFSRPAQGLREGNAAHLSRAG